MVARLSAEEMKNTKLKDILGPLKGVINAVLPLAKAPPLHDVRNALLFEFPYAGEVIDFALADLVGRTTIRLRPLLLCGDAGGGKSRFGRRLGELLGVSVWRTDASRCDDCRGDPAASRDPDDEALITRDTNNMTNSATRPSESRLPRRALPGTTRGQRINDASAGKRNREHGEHDRA